MMPVSDWTTDFDVLEPGYVRDPAPVWDDLRQRCPMARSDRRGRTWLPTRYRDIVAVARDPIGFSSRQVTVVPFPGKPEDSGALPFGLPPITVDPPLHAWTRRLLLPRLSSRKVAQLRAPTQALCNALLDELDGRSRVDAAADYARRIPTLAAARILGVEADTETLFTAWVADVLEHAEDRGRRRHGMKELLVHFWKAMEQRRAGGCGDDLLGDLLQAEHGGRPLDDGLVLGMLALVVLAGVDTSWSAIAAALWHLAAHPADAERMRSEPWLMPSAVEELLRLYAPVTMARVVQADGAFAGCPVAAGDRVLLSFAAANRDPDIFDAPHQMVLDRDHHRHLAFGAGIHRCAGSALARMQMQVAIETWLDRVGVVTLAPDAPVTWVGGQVRGPKSVPVSLAARRAGGARQQNARTR